MIFFFYFSFSSEFFRFKSDQLYVKSGDIIEITFTGMKNSENPLIYPFDYNNLLCKTYPKKQFFTSFGDNLLGIYKERIFLQAKFLIDNFSTNCFCSHTLKNIHKSEIKKLIKHNYFLSFELDKFKLSSEGNEGIPIGIHNLVYNHLNIYIHYNQIDEDLYEIVGLTGAGESFVHNKLPNNVCYNTFQPFIMSNSTELSYSYSISFVNSKLASLPLSSFKQQEKQIVILLISNSILLCILLYFIKYKYTAENWENIWRKVKGDIFRAPRQTIHICILVGTGVQIIVTFFISSLFVYKSYSELIETLFNILPFCGLFAGFTSIKIIKFIGRSDWKHVYKGVLSFLPSFFVLIFSIKSMIHYGYASSGIPTNGTFLHIICLIIIHFICVSIGSYLSFKTPSIKPPCKVGMQANKIHRAPFYMKTNFMRITGGIYVFINLYKTIDFMFLCIVNKDIYESSPYAFTLFFLLLIITSSIVSLFYVYLQVWHGNYKWWWTSFSIPASVFMIYAFYAYNNLKKYRVCSIISIIFSILDNITIAGSLAIACGSIGFFSTMLCLIKIYTK